MRTNTWLLAVMLGLIFAQVASAQQYPVMEAVANKVIQKYQTSSCQQLSQERAQAQGKPKPANEQRAIDILHQDPNMRVAFLNKVAAPIANKMFECGMIP